MTRHRDEYDVMMEHLSKNKDVERGLVHLQTTPCNQNDPVVREMATAVLHELDKAKKRREMRYRCTWIALILFVIVVVVTILAGGFSKGRRH